MTHQTKRRLAFLAGFVFYFGALWALWDTAFVYPLKIFVVLLHEISHAAVAVATGGTIERIVLDPNQGGACYCPGGSAFLTLSAGYLGSLGWGAYMRLTTGVPPDVQWQVAPSDDGPCRSPWCGSGAPPRLLSQANE